MKTIKYLITFLKILFSQVQAHKEWALVLVVQAAHLSIQVALNSKEAPSSKEVPSSKEALNSKVVRTGEAALHKEAEGEVAEGVVEDEADLFVDISCRPTDVGEAMAACFIIQVYMDHPYQIMDLPLYYLIHNNCGVKSLCNICCKIC